MVLALCLSPLSKGYVTGYMSPTLNELVTGGLLPSSFAVDFFAAAIYIGSALSCFISGWYADKFGRRGALMASAVPLFCGWVLITGQWGCASLLVGRLLNGFGSAVVFTTFGIYVAETVAASRRGAWTVLGEASISAGAMLALGLGQWLNARWLAVVAVVVAVTVFAAVSQVPETPRYYLEHNRIEDARRSLDWIRGAPADAEFAALKAQLDDHPSHKVQPANVDNSFKHLYVCHIHLTDYKNRTSYSTTFYLLNCRSGYEVSYHVTLHKKKLILFN